MPFHAKTEVSDQDVADLAITAFECNDMTASWCGGVKPAGALPEGCASPWYSDAKFWASDFQLVVAFDDPEGEAPEGTHLAGKVIGKDDVQKGFDLWAEKQPSSFGDFLQQEADAETADIWWRFVVLGDVIYG